MGAGQWAIRKAAHSSKLIAHSTQKILSYCLFAFSYLSPIAPCLSPDIPIVSMHWQEYNDVQGLSHGEKAQKYS